MILTTNGTLLNRQQNILLKAPALHKVNISLHAFEANDFAVSFEQYLDDCFAFGRAAAGNKLVVYRLWNQGGADERNDAIVARMKSHFTAPWVVEQKGIRVDQRVYLEYGEKFDWPDENAEVRGNTHSCYGLRDQIGVLSDGTVVPCCLDAEGAIPLGNLYRQSVEEILASDRAVRLKKSFENRRIEEPLCQRCGYAAMKNY